MYLVQSQSPFFISTSSLPTLFFGGGGGCFTLGGGLLMTGGGRLGSIGIALNLTISCSNLRITVFTDFIFKRGLFSTVSFTWWKPNDSKIRITSRVRASSSLRIKIYPLPHLSLRLHELHTWGQSKASVSVQFTTSKWFKHGNR